jgi:DNA primase
VTCTFGANGINEDLWALIHDKRPRWIVMAQDNDKAGNDAVAKLAPRLAELGIGVKRVALPPGVDVNAYACQSADASRALASLLEESAVIVTHATTAAIEQVEQLKEKAPEPSSTLDPQPTPEPEQAPAASSLAAESPAAPPSVLSASSVVNPSSLHPEQRGEDLFFKIGDRKYRVRGLAKNTSFEALKINLRVRIDDDRYHQDNVDMARAKEREHFARVAALEASLKEDVIKRDLSRLLLKLEELQEENIRRTLEPRQPEIPGMTEAERNEALALLRDPKLLDRILADFDACGVVGEDTNKLVGYLAALSRKFDKPLGVIIQSTSAAGKTTRPSGWR